MAYKDIEKQRAYHREKQRLRRLDPVKNEKTNARRRAAAALPENKERIRAANRKWREQSVDGNLTKSVAWQRERRKARPSDYLLFDAKRRASKKKVPYAVSADEALRIANVMSAGFCEITKLPFASLEGTRNPWSPSLDRIKPELGYVDGNIRVVVWAYNAAKSEWSHDVLLRLAHAIVDNPVT